MSGKTRVAVDAQIAALVPRFLANRAADVGRIRAALALGDFDTICAIAHAMRGAGGAYGFPEISRAGAAIEEGAQQRDAALISAPVSILEAYLARVEIKPAAGSGAAREG